MGTGRPRNGAARRRLTSIFGHPSTTLRTTLGTDEPAARIGVAEHTAIAVAAVRMLTELAQAVRRHRAARQGQVRRFA